MKCCLNKDIKKSDPFTDHSIYLKMFYLKFIPDLESEQSHRFYQSRS